MPALSKTLPLAVALVVAVAVGLAGCAGLPGSANPSPSFTSPADLAVQVGELPGVVSAELSGDYVIVTIAATADDATVLSTARAANEIAEGWDGEVDFVREGRAYDPVTDTSSRSPWDEVVYPGDPDEVEARLSEVLAIEKLPDVVSVSVDDGWPSVILGSLDTFAESFRAMSALPSFSNGGTYSYAGEVPRLHIVHIAERMSPESIEAVIRIAVEHPAAEVELQSLTSVGNRWPELYVAGLTPDEVVVVHAQLSDPALADADPEGYPIPFQLATLTGEGRVLTFGTFGAVPE
jgi:hypothetical protein